MSLCSSMLEETNKGFIRGNSPTDCLVTVKPETFTVSVKTVPLTVDPSPKAREKATKD